MHLNDKSRILSQLFFTHDSCLFASVLEKMKVNICTINLKQKQNENETKFNSNFNCKPFIRHANVRTRTSF